MTPSQQAAYEQGLKEGKELRDTFLSPHRVICIDSKRDGSLTAEKIKQTILHMGPPLGFGICEYPTCCPSPIRGCKEL